MTPEGPDGECGGSRDLSDYAKKTWVDTQNNLTVAKAGDTITGALAISNCKVTGLACPTAAHEAAMKLPQRIMLIRWASLLCKYL